MRKIILVTLSALFVVLSSCKKDDDIVIEPELALFNFTFEKGYNNDIQNDITLTYDGEIITGWVPLEADINNLTASFEFTGAEVRIGNKLQQSNITSNDFSKAVIYTVIGNDSSTRDFTVEVSWYTGLPIINIFTDNGLEITSKEDYIQGEAYVFGGKLFENSSGDMKIRGRGHSTWGVHPKKPYQMKFDDKTEVLDMPKAKKWIFLAEHSDKTLIRNSIAFEMGYISNLDWTPRCEYSEVFINNEYNGTYNITEKVEAGEDRVNIGDNGFLCEIDTPDHLSPDDIYFNSTRFTIQVKEPEITTGSSEFNYIRDHVIEFEEILFSSIFKDPVYGYRKYLDISSVIDWYLINEISKNVDAKDYSSMYFNHIPGEKIKMGPLWDFDLAFGNVDYADSQYPEGFWVKDHQWISRLFEDPAFVLEVKDRFAYFLDNEDYLLGLIDEKAKYLRFAQEENNNKWDLFGNYVWPNPVVYDTHQQEVNHLKDWFKKRMSWLDEAYSSM